MGIQEVSVFRVIQEVSARRLRKELISHNLYLFAWPFKVDYGWPFVNDAKFKKYIYSILKTKYICTQGIILHPATLYLCSFKEVYLFNFKEMIYLLTVKEILILSNNIYLFTKSIIIRGNYISTRNYIHFNEPYQFVQFKEIYPRWTKYIHSGKLYPFKEIHLFKEHIFPASDTIYSPKSDMPASEPFISKGTIEHSSNCEFLLKMYHFLSFWKSLSSTKLTYTGKRSPLRFTH